MIYRFFEYIVNFIKENKYDIKQLIILWCGIASSIRVIFLYDDPWSALVIYVMTFYILYLQDSSKKKDESICRYEYENKWLCNKIYEILENLPDDDTQDRPY